MSKKEIINLPEQAEMAVVPVDVDSLVAMVDAFDQFKSKVLKDTDFWLDPKSKKRRVKKSGWLKYALACNVNLMKTEEREIDKEMPPGSGEWVTIYHFDYRAIAQSGRYAEASGSASTSERAKSDKMIHDTRSLAQTRAMNRAISNLIGGGEVSAEEAMDTRRYTRSNQSAPPKPKPVKKPEPVIEQFSLQLNKDEEKVKATMIANDLDTDHCTIYTYLGKLIVKPSKDFPGERFNEYNKTLGKLLKAEWNAKEERWEVPI